MQKFKKKYLPPFAGPFPFLSIFSLHQSYVAEGRESETSGCSAARAAATRQGPPPAARWRNALPPWHPAIGRPPESLAVPPLACPAWPCSRGYAAARTVSRSVSLPLFLGHTNRRDSRGGRGKLLWAVGQESRTHGPTGNRPSFFSLLPYS
jgi:hypothetical protein